MSQKKKKKRRKWRDDGAIFQASKLNGNPSFADYIWVTWCVRLWGSSNFHQYILFAVHMPINLLDFVSAGNWPVLTVCVVPHRGKEWICANEGESFFFARKIQNPSPHSTLSLYHLEKYHLPWPVKSMSHCSSYKLYIELLHAQASTKNTLFLLLLLCFFSPYYYKSPKACPFVHPSIDPFPTTKCVRICSQKRLHATPMDRILLTS